MKQTKGIISLLIVFIILLGVYIAQTIFISDRHAKHGEARNTVNDAPIRDNVSIHTKDLPLSTEAAVDLSFLNLYSPYVLLVNLTDHQVIFESNSEKIMYPASLTKIMTTIVAIEHLPSVHDRITIDPGMFDYLIKENASVAGFLPNEEVLALDLLYGTMLPSGADASISLANYIAGSEEEFVELMNQKAEQLGMENTHYTNTTGLHNSNHYSTAKDIAILLDYAIKNPTFLEIFTSKTHYTMPTNLHPEGITFHSTMFNKMNSSILENGVILGGKTGYTSEAGLCLASLATINGDYYILVTTGANGNNRTLPYHILDALTVYEGLQKAYESVS